MFHSNGISSIDLINESSHHASPNVAHNDNGQSHCGSRANPILGLRPAKTVLKHLNSNKRSTRPVVYYDCAAKVIFYDIALEDIYFHYSHLAQFQRSQIEMDKAVELRSILKRMPEKARMASKPIGVQLKEFLIDPHLDVAIIEDKDPSDWHFAVPAVPTSFFPGLEPKSACLLLTTHVKRDVPVAVSGPVATGV
ncbi:uncharacterized protein KD926_003087 [Aspergillus affinis]|uniref:uncharacterized protein n=1 Tax=Aspergillus affinis TaxID=1070780 RepID=UPI0022FECBE3|nr:uncharacterized protein KD926_003087 [Aspergillus affinis]KAI9043736.1 hypothetical protein KD926_003087 [Aspergillus affinis]